MIPFVAAAEIPCFGRKNSCFFVLRSLREELGHWTNAPVPLVCCRCSASTYQTGPFFYVTGNVKNSGKNILKIFFVKKKKKEEERKKEKRKKKKKKPTKTIADRCSFPGGEIPHITSNTHTTDRKK